MSGQVRVAVAMLAVTVVTAVGGPHVGSWAVAAKGPAGRRDTGGEGCLHGNNSATGCAMLRYSPQPSTTTWT